MNSLNTSRFFRLLFSALLLLGMAFFASRAFAAPPDFVADRILLKAKANVPEVAVRALLAAHGGKQVGAVKALDVRIVKVPAAALERVLAALQRDPAVEFAEKDYIAEANLTANDPYYTGGNEWHLAKIQAPTAWDVTTGSASVVIAVVDTGANYSHPDLAAKLLPGYNFISNTADATDDNGHGTGVSGTAAAASNNSIGVASVAWLSPILPVKALDASGSGSYSGIANGITYAADHGARIINLSMGGSSSSTTLQNAINYAWKKDIVLVAAAGNNGDSNPVYPAGCANVVAVSATRSDDSMAAWSSYGPNVDVAAPGEGIVTTYGSDYAGVSGTSFSSPMTAGVVALMAAAKPELTNAQLVDLLIKNSDDLGAAGFDNYYGNGRINAGRAVLAARGTVTADTAAPTVVFDAPADGAILAGTVNIDVTAVDNVGVTKVELYIDGQNIGSASSGSVTYSWNTGSVSDGAHNLEARAYDAANNVGSATIAVTVRNSTTADSVAPTVQVTSPAAGSRVSRIQKVQLASSDNIGVSKVELYIDGKLSGTSSSSSPSFNWNTNKAASGSHTLQGFAYDAAGNVGESAVVTVYK